jgi:toxin ParE1/3/4
MKRFRLSRLAESDLEQTWLFVAEQSGVSRADSLLSEIEECFRLLLRFPESGRKREDLGENLRSLPVAGFVVVYRLSADVLEVVRVVHGARDIQTLFE